MRKQNEDYDIAHDDHGDVCPICDGDGVDEQGHTCKECGGKGYA